MKEREPERTGKLFVFRLPTIELGQFWVVNIDRSKMEEGSRFNVKDMELLFAGEDCKVDLWEGLGVVRREMCAGKDVGMAFNKDEEIKWPEGWK